jgi:predicted transcriptional regulator
MDPTTIKLPDGLKRRIASLVEGSGKSVHAFLVSAIERATHEAELRQKFVARAVASRREFARTRKAYDVDEVHAALSAQIAGKKPRRPRARSWPK